MLLTWRQKDRLREISQEIASCIHGQTNWQKNIREDFGQEKLKMVSQIVEEYSLCSGPDQTKDGWFKMDGKDVIDAWHKSSLADTIKYILTRKKV